MWLRQMLLLGKYVLLRMISEVGNICCDSLRSVVGVIVIAFYIVVVVAIIIIVVRR